MLHRFTERTLRVIEHSRQDADRMRAGSIGTGHILLGIIRERDCEAAKALQRLKIDLDRLRDRLERELAPGPGAGVPPGALQPDKDALRIFERARDCARALGHEAIATEHLLAAFLEDREGLVGRVLSEMGVRVPPAGGGTRPE